MPADTADQEVQREVRDSDVADQHRKILQLSLEEVMAAARTRHPDRSQETIELFARARLQTSMSAFDVLTPPNPGYKQLVSSMDIPALLLFGDKGVVTPAVAEELQHLNPRLQVEQIPGAGHSLHIDQPQRFAAAVKTFLEYAGK
ncbi:alpha/beta hydrolase [Chitinophaga sp.]|uniref:alpha/beta fold hydrolase n=1 Tax=Chitinophaga sp. TaxID=1869181 RepID=UPI002F95AE84